MNGPRGLLGLAALLVAIALAAWCRHERSGATRSTTATPEPAPVEDRANEESEARRPDDATDGSTTGIGDASANRSVVAKLHDPKLREKMREAIWRALNTPAPVPPVVASPSASADYVLPQTLPPPPAGEAGQIEPEYIQQRIRDDFWGRARWCYQQALKGDPTLHGEVALGFTIVGDEKVGGIVESMDVLDRSTLRDPGMIACMRDYFLDNVTFPPPTNGGYVQVIYPMVFEPEDAAQP